MPALLPSDIIQGLQTTLIDNPLIAEEKRKKNLQQQLESDRYGAQTPDSNAQMALATEQARANLGRFNSETPDVLAQLGIKTNTDKLGIPVKEEEAKLAGVKSNILDERFPGGKPTPIQQLAPDLPVGEQVQALKSKINQDKMYSGMGIPVGPENENTLNNLLASERAKAFSEIAAIPKGGTKSSLRDQQTALENIAAKYPHLAGDQGFEKRITEAKPANADYNNLGLGAAQARTIQSDVNSLRSRSLENSKRYDIARKALDQGEGAYKKYLENPNSPDAKATQQTIIDKFVQVSLQKSPTESQISLIQSWPGLENVVDKATGKIKEGKIVPDALVDGMMDNMRREATELGSDLKYTNQVDIEAGQSNPFGEIDPKRYIRYPSEGITADSTKWANAPLGKKKTTGTGPKFIKH